MNPWQLRGPASFIAAVRERLQAGNSVIVGLPRCGCEGIVEALSEPLQTAQWLVESLTAHPGDPALVQVTQALYIEPEWAEWSVAGLFEEMQRPQSNRAVVIDGIDAASWDHWRRFLTEYEVASRSSSAYGRPVLVAIVRGVAPAQLRAPGAAMEVTRWAEVVGELDTISFVDSLVRERGLSGSRRRLAVRQIASVASWDLELARFLATLPNECLFDPLAALGRACEGHDAAFADRPRSWEGGGLDAVEGEELAHAVVLVRSGDPKKELQRRIWAAQASELLPLIEVRRRELAGQMERYVKCPLDVRGTIEHSVHDLEIGPLAHVARTTSTLKNSALLTRVEFLANLRNTLAHLRTADASSVQSPHLHAQN